MAGDTVWAVQSGCGPVTSTVEIGSNLNEGTKNTSCNQLWVLPARGLHLIKLLANSVEICAETI
jgi:hypothetical protein